LTEVAVEPVTAGSAIEVVAGLHGLGVRVSCRGKGIEEVDAVATPQTLALANGALRQGVTGTCPQAQLICACRADIRN